MIQTDNKQPHTNPENIKEFKDDALAQKGRTKHIVETDWPVKEVIQPAERNIKKRKVNKTQTARLP